MLGYALELRSIPRVRLPAHAALHKLKIFFHHAFAPGGTDADEERKEMLCPSGLRAALAKGRCWKVVKSKLRLRRVDAVGIAVPQSGGFE